MLRGQYPTLVGNHMTSILQRRDWRFRERGKSFVQVMSSRETTIQMLETPPFVLWEDANVIGLRN